MNQPEPDPFAAEPVSDHAEPLTPAEWVEAILSTVQECESAAPGVGARER